jgi:MipA family protein
MRPLLLTLFAGLLASAAGSSRAEDDRKTRFEGAIGLVSSFGPAYGGAEDQRWRLSPAGFIRYGRFTISGAGGFTTRRADDVERGFAANLDVRDDLRLSLSARWTGGRKESNSDRLAGLGDVDATLLARLRLQWRPDNAWTWSAAVNSDLLGHGSGWILDLGGARHWRISPSSQVQVGGSLTYGGDTYMQSWYGVTAEQSQRSGYKVFKPGNGLRDLSFGATLRTEFSRDWAGFVSAGSSLHIGPAADSPLVQKKLGFTVSGGVAWRF